MVCCSNGNYWTADIKVMLFWWSDPLCISFQSQVAFAPLKIDTCRRENHVYQFVIFASVYGCALEYLGEQLSPVKKKKSYYLSSYTLLHCPSNLLIRKINVWINVILSAFSLPPLRWCWVALLLCSVYQPACTCVAMDCIICRLWGLSARKLNWKNPETDWSC